MARLGAGSDSRSVRRFGDLRPTAASFFRLFLERCRIFAAKKDLSKSSSGKSLQCAQAGVSLPVCRHMPHSPCENP